MQMTRTRKSGRRAALGRPSPNKRDRENNGRNRCFRESIVSVRLIKPPARGWTEYNAEIVPESPIPNGLVRFKKSLRWCEGTKAGTRWHHIPFIDRYGQIHATSVARWRASAPQLLATITSTVFKRLWGRTRKGPHKYRPKADLLYRVAQLYAITNDDSFYRRCLSMLLYNRRAELSKFTYYFLKKLDANNRFLYDQALNGALWFQSRADRCPRRALSNVLKEVQRDSQRLSSYGSRCNFDRLITAWARVYSGPSAVPLYFTSSCGRLTSTTSGTSMKPVFSSQ